MNKAYLFRIYPNDVQQKLMIKTFGCVRFVYNRMLSDKIKAYQEAGKKLRTTPASYKEEFPFLKEVDSLALANAQLHLETAYKNFFTRKEAGFPKFKAKKKHQSYTTNLVNGNISLKDGFLTLPKLGKVKIKQHRFIPNEYQLKSVTVTIRATGEYYVSILYDCKDELIEGLKHINPEKILGIDFSMKELAVLSDGRSASYPGYYCNSQEKLAKEQRKLAKCQKGSKNREKQRVRVAKLHDKVSRQRKDFLHKLSRQITNAYDAVCVEDLNMKGMAQALHFGKKVNDDGFGLFVSYMEYKLRWEGKKLVKVSRWYASSKICSGCGRIKRELPLSERTYRCECGIVIDRDINAAINIREEGIRMLSA